MKRQPSPLLCKRAIAVLVAALQVVPASLLTQVAHAQQTVATEYGYDAQGNLTTVKDPNQKTTTITYDNLDRIKDQTLPKPKATASNPVVSYTFDGLNRLLSVTDPRGVPTTYAYTGLFDSYQYSKDTGGLINYFDLNGALNYRTNNRVQSWFVADTDAINRPKVIYNVDDYSGVIKGQTRLNYDEYITTAGSENYGKGHLTRVVEYGATASQLISGLSLRYDQLGRVTRRCQFWNGVSPGTATTCADSDALFYRWGPNDSSQTNAGRLLGLTYPSGRLVNYQYNALGQITGITTQDSSAGAVKSVISSATYTPLAVAEGGYAVTGWNFGDGVATPKQSYSRRYDTSARLSSFSLGVGAVGLQTQQNAYSLTLDQAGRIKQIDNQTAQSTVQSNVYGYDDLNRLIQASLPGGVNYSYDYDANGNRVLKTSTTLSSVYAYSGTSNRLLTQQDGAAAAQTIKTDATGNIKLDPAAAVGAAVTYTYDDRTNLPYGRLVQSQGPGAQWSYVHNYFGQRIRKTGASYTPSGGSAIAPAPYVGSTDTTFQYDMEGHLIAELDSTTLVNGKLLVKREYVWLGDTLVAVMAGSTPTTQISASNAAAIYYVHNDHLDTPRLVTDTAGNRRWSWDLMAAEPFGATQPNEAPASQATAQAFTLNIRFPGQYLDKETGSFYNYFRTYNPSTGRYVQSDPIGLAGGLNTYSYVEGNPVGDVDPLGLAACLVNFPDYPIDTGFGFSSTNLGGHGGVLSYDSQGSTNYYEYGRYLPSNQYVIGDKRPELDGNVRRVPVPDLVIDPKTGQPTSASLEALRKALSDRAGHKTQPKLTCDQSADETKVNKWAEDFAKSSSRPKYSWKPWSSNQCRDFASRAYGAGR
jgi:RHS repeat-associated protein